MRRGVQCVVVVVLLVAPAQAEARTLELGAGQLAVARELRIDPVRFSSATTMAVDGPTSSLQATAP